MHDISSLKLLTRLRLHFSHLNEHEFRHNFKDSISQMCSCGFETETKDHYSLCCKLSSVLSLRIDLLNGLFYAEIFLISALIVLNEGSSLSSIWLTLRILVISVFAYLVFVFLFFLIFKFY